MDSAPLDLWAFGPFLLDPPSASLQGPFHVQWERKKLMVSKACSVHGVFWACRFETGFPSITSLFVDPVIRLFAFLLRADISAAFIIAHPDASYDGWMSLVLPWGWKWSRFSRPCPLSMPKIFLWNNQGHWPILLTWRFGDVLPCVWKSGSFCGYSLWISWAHPLVQLLLTSWQTTRQANPFPNYFFG